MAVEDLPEGFVTFTRDEIKTKRLRDYKLKNPAADITSGQPVLEAELISDQLGPLYSNASLMADGINEDAATGPRQDRVGARIGVPRGKATGATGFVAIEAGAGGGTIQIGDELENPHTRLRYASAETIHRNDGEHIRIRAKSTGPGTDLDPDTVLRWTSPRPGIGQHATVVEQSGGRGLTGGAEQQNDASYLVRIQDHKRNPPAGDNDAEIVTVILSTPDVPIEQVFTVPGFYGPGSSAYTFTVLANELGASRIPATSQLQTVFAWMTEQLPGDHGYPPLEIVGVEYGLGFQVRWSKRSPGWADTTPFPASLAVPVTVSAATDATHFSITGGAPVAGNTLAVWDGGKRKFRRKRVLSVTGSGPYAVVCDTTNGASDTSFTPAVGQRVSPWSDSLQALVPPVLAHFSKLGPGECFDVLSGERPNEGRRRRRQPETPSSYPDRVSDSVLTDIGILPEVDSYSVPASLAESVDVGIPPNMWVLDDLYCFPNL